VNRPGSRRRGGLDHRPCTHGTELYLLPEDVAEAIVYLLGQSERAWTQEMTLWPFRVFQLE
jgi:hypothetical protein